MTAYELIMDIAQQHLGCPQWLMKPALAMAVRSMDPAVTSRLHETVPPEKEQKVRELMAQCHSAEDMAKLMADIRGQPGFEPKRLNFYIPEARPIPQTPLRIPEAKNAK